AEIDVSCELFEGLFVEIDVARYHSLAAEESSLPDVLQVISRTKDGEIMAIKHRDYDIYGLQFHPESILTPEGKTILKNFIKIAERRTAK
ncbi:MAG: gamma-glutamyl-gamma-aminobutyrate hydrolase family protein, partial [Clostridiales bacterium]|nr:gamma-glutamyl-gamma-aminobutyrate hydrolase family protein [Clostridiales bacterium]